MCIHISMSIGAHVCVCVCVCACVHTRTCMCACVIPKLTSDVFLDDSPHTLLRKDLAESPASQPAQGLSLSPEFWDYRWPQYLLGLYMGSGITDGRCTCPAFTVLYPVSYLVSPIIFF